MRIDLHCHCYPKEYLRELGRSGVADPSSVVGIQIPPWDGIEARLAAMKDAMVDMEVLSVAAPSVFFADKQVSLTLAQICNDSLAELCSQEPKRFLGLISVPLPDVPTTIDELHRALRKPGMVGVLLGTNIAGKALDSREFWPFYEELDRLQLPAFIHPMEPVGMPYVRDYKMIPMMGFLFETCIAATRLVLSGVTEKYSKFPIVLSHLGGVIPFISDRIDHNARVHSDVRQNLTKLPSDYLRQMYYDTAHGYTAIPLSCAYSYLGDDQIVLGTDYPLNKVGHMKTVPGIEASALPYEAKEKIFWRNATRLLGIA